LLGEPFMAESALEMGLIQPHRAAGGSTRWPNARPKLA
jgi:hypothetical protein